MKFQILVDGDTIETETKSEAVTISRHIDKAHKVNLVIGEKQWGPFSGMNMWAEVAEALQVIGYRE